LSFSRFNLIWVLLAAAALCRVGMAEQDAFVYFTSPLAAGSDEGTYLLLHRGLLFGKTDSFVLLYRGADGKVSEPGEYQGGYSAAAAYGGFLYVFHGDTYSLYSGEKHADSRPWPFPSWTPCGAVSVADSLYVLGAEAAQLTVVRLADGEWVQGGLSPTAPGRIGEVRAVALKDGFLAVVAEKIEDGPRPLYSIQYSEGRWHPWQEVMTLPASGEFALVSESPTHLLYRERRGRLTARYPLRERTWTEQTGWSDATDTGIRESLATASYVTAACSSEGRPRAFLLAPYSGLVSEAVWSEAGGWRLGERFAALPSLLGVSLWGVILNSLVTAAFLLAVAISLVLRRGRSTKSELGGHVVQLASWRRRVAAGLIDGFVVFVGVDLSLALFMGGRSATADTVMWGFLIAYVTYYAVLESMTGQTMGKALMDITVVGRNGARAPVPAVVIRSVLRVVEVIMMPLLGLLVLLNTRQQQRLGDLAAHTYVIVSPRQPTAEHPEWDINDFD